MVEMGGSDLHITTNSPPQIRVDGKLQPLDLPPLDAGRDQAARLQRADRRAEAALRGEPRARLLVRHQGPGALPLQRLQPARRRRRRLPRRSPTRSSSFDELGLPPVLADARASSRAASCWSPARPARGKSTTLAAMIDKINTRAPRAHPHHRGPDRVSCTRTRTAWSTSARCTPTRTSFAQRAARRAAPGPRRRARRRDARPRDDRVGAAHRRDGPPDASRTLHTNSAAQTINRIIDVFPAHQQAQIRAQLSFVLEGIVCQALLPKADGKGRVVALEILVPNPAIRNLIREDKVHQIYSTMQTGQDKRHADHQPVAGHAVSASGSSRSRRR